MTDDPMGLGLGLPGLGDHGGDAEADAGAGGGRAEDVVAAAEAWASDLRLARLHLRLGALALARAELEAADAEEALEGEPLLDLAEARWRTGALAPAGAAAEAWLDAPGSPGSTLATVIAVEAALAGGRPSDARRRHEALTPVAPGALDSVFNGMPRAAIWPAAGDGVARPVDHDTLPGGRATGASGSAPVASPRSVATGDVAAELEAARADLEAGADDAAGIRLSLVLRLSPQLAPAVLEVLEGSDGPLLHVVRGDAYRLVGRGIEAERAWRAAASEVARVGVAQERRAAGAAGVAPYADSTAGPGPRPADQPSFTHGAQAPDRAPESEETP